MVLSPPNLEKHRKKALFMKRFIKEKSLTSEVVKRLIGSHGKR